MALVAPARSVQDKTLENPAKTGHDMTPSN